VKGVYLEFAPDGKCTTGNPRMGGEIKGTYHLDTTKTVKEITFEVEGQKSMLGIYKLNGDDLTICVVEDGQGDRPTEFATKADNKVSLIVFKREKK